MTKREKLILFITIAVVIFGIVFNFFIAPILKESQRLNSEINITTAKLRRYLGLISKKESIQNKYDKFITGKNLSQESKDPFVVALSLLEDMAKDANIRIVDIRPQTSKNLDLYKEIVVDLRTEGDIESYLKFLYSIENSLTLLKIKKFQLNSKPNSQLLEGNFSVSQISLE